MQRAWGYLLRIWKAYHIGYPYGCLVPPHHDRHSSRARDTQNAQIYVQPYGHSVYDPKGSRGDLPPAAPSTHKFPVSSESCLRQPRRLCPLCPQVRVEWDRDAHAIGRRHVCNELGEPVGWVRVRKVAPCMCCARPLAHAFCRACSNWVQKLVPKVCPLVQHNCNQREKIHRRAAGRHLGPLIVHG